MSETVWVAIIAVVGTSLGAAISPAITALRDVTISRADANDNRVEATAAFAEKLMTLALRTPEKFDGPAVRTALNEALAARFALARHLGKGEGNVDRFAEGAISLVQRYSDERRELVAQVATGRLLAWARKDLGASKLKPFWKLLPRKYLR
ncbi:hypothetical protein [Microbacterium sp. NPDC056569]|uniref:hypothetical protein n=1 Tax=Microbacterium sp. NPDC056569 TaxID=3345867 RepID=UPI0036710438